MSFLNRIEEDIKTAMKSREAERLSTLRLVKTALKNKEIDKMAPLTDEESIKILLTLVKQRRDSIEQYRAASRPELADKEADEIKIIEHYLPAAPDEAQITKIIEEIIAELGASTMKDLGNVMKAVTAKFSGQPVDGKVVNQIVRSKLS